MCAFATSGVFLVLHNTAGQRRFLLAQKGNLRLRVVMLWFSMYWYILRGLHCVNLLAFVASSSDICVIMHSLI